MGRSCILNSHPSRCRVAALQMPAVVRMPACCSRIFKGERPVGAATGYQSQPPRPCATPPPRPPGPLPPPPPPPPLKHKPGHTPWQSSANLLSVTMASSMVAVYYKSMEEYRSTPLRRSASPTIANYGLSSTRTIVGTPSRYRSASPGIVDYGSSSTQAMRAAPSRRSSTSASIAQYTMLATPSALTPLSRSQSSNTATHDGFPVVRKVRPLSSQPAVSASWTRVATEAFSWTPCKAPQFLQESNIS